MVTITAKHNFDEKMLCLETKGHAGYDKPGRDIVCASVSILMYTLAQVVKDMHDSGAIGECAIMFSDGDACIKCRCRDQYAFNEALQNYSVIEVGCSLLAHNYPQYVSLEDLT